MDDNRALIATLKMSTTVVAFVSLLGFLVSTFKNLSGSVLGEQPVAPAPAPTGSVPASPSNPIDWSTVRMVALYALIGVLAIAAVVTLVVFVINPIRRRSALRAAEAKEARKARAELAHRWKRGVALYDGVHEQYTRFLFPETAKEYEDRYFELSLLDDTDEVATDRFLEALEMMGSRYASELPQRANDAQVSEFVESALRARRALDAAEENSRSKFRRHIASGGRSLTRDERKRVERARSLLRQALEPQATVEFARTALDKVNELLTDAGISVSERLRERIALEIESTRQQALEAVNN
jgi:heme exporter protein D